MKFKYYVETDNLKITTKEARALIEDQLQFMYGGMGFDDVVGVPRGDHHVEITPKPSWEMTKNGKLRIGYSFEGVVLLHKGPTKWDTFFMPRDPTKKGSYDPAVVHGINKATDEHYNTFGDYWYFWDPDKKGSPLKKGVDYDEVKAHIDRIRNTERSEPEYERLVDRKTKTIPISVFFGMDDPNHSQNINRSQDWGAKGYRGMRTQLEKEGFKEVEIDNEELSRIMMGRKFKRPSVQRFEKDTPKGKIVVTMTFSPTQINENSHGFHYFYKDALENAAVVIYDGHSGLGSNLDLKTIEEAENFKIRHHPYRYQIMFFDSCTSYAYYNLSYQVLKGRKNKTRSLDIFATGLETEFDETQKANMAIIHAINQWAIKDKKETYQSLSEKMEQANLLVINGDEDNPPHLKRPETDTKKNEANHTK